MYRNLSYEDMCYIEENSENQSPREIAAELGEPVHTVRAFLNWLESARERERVPVAWGERDAEVDIELAPLILTLWEAGIGTSNSSQERWPGISWIEFLTASDAEQFLDLIAPTTHGEEGGDETWALHNRILGPYAGGQWHFDFCLNVRE